MDTENHNFHKDAMILFDGYCNLCSASVQFILRHEKMPYYSFSSIQSDFVSRNFPDLEVDKNYPDSVILIEEGKIFFQSDAALRILRRLKFPFYIFSFFRFIPKFLRDPVYRLIASNRYSLFGRSHSCYVPQDNVSERFFS